MSLIGPSTVSSGGGYSLTGVASHKINETLGLGSALDGASDVEGTASVYNVGSLDFFRYSGYDTVTSTGIRSFTSDSAATSYFSDDGGKTPIVNFNQAGGGSDYHDWATGTTPQVQDAFSTPNTTANAFNGASEYQALNDVGYNRSNGNPASPAPEPSEFAGLGFAALSVLGLVLRAKKRKTA